MGHGRRFSSRVPTRSAPLTDSSHRSIMNSSNAMDSLSMLMRRWHSLHVADWVSCCSIEGAPEASYGVSGHILRQEELELLIGEGAQLRAQHIVDSDMVSVPSGGSC